MSQEPQKAQKGVTTNVTAVKKSARTVKSVKKTVKAPPKKTRLAASHRSVHKTEHPQLDRVYDKTTKVNVVIPLKNRGKFITLLMQNIQRIVNKTGEKNIKVWIGDFHSTDVNLKALAEKHTFPIEIVLFRGVFKIALALQRTAEKVTNPDEILYFCDGDSVFPDDIFNRIRRLTIKNEQFYAPMVARPARGGKIIPPFPPNGHGGKGNVGVYVDDFQKSGGWGVGYFSEDKALGKKSGDPMARVRWGKHDEHIWHLLLRRQKLKAARPRECDQYTRWHQPRIGWGK